MPMLLRSRMVGTPGEDGLAVASASSSSMDENSSIEAVVGSPATRRSWSTHGSLNQPSSPAPDAPSSAHPHSYDATLYEPSRGENTYLTDYETATQAEQSEYPTEISDSQDLAYHSQAQSQSPEESALYVQQQSPLQPPSHPYVSSYIYGSPQTSTPRQPHLQLASYHNPYMTPMSQPPAAHQFGGYNPQPQYAGYDRQSMTAYSPMHTRPQYSPYQPRLITPYQQPPSHVPDYQVPVPAPIFTHFPPYQVTPTFQPIQPSPPNYHQQQQIHTQTPTPTSEALSRFVAPDAEQSWSPVRESHKRRRSEADSPVEKDKLQTELDEMDSPPKKKKTRWTRGRAKPRRGSGSKDRGGKGKRGGRGGGGGSTGQGVTS